MNNTNTDELLKSFESLYQSEKYSDAVDLLLKNKSLFAEGIFHYNLGTIYAKKNEFGIARYHFEKAKKYGYSSSELKNNQKYILKNIQTYQSENTLGGIVDNYYRVLTLPNSSLFIFTLVILNMFIFLRLINKIGKKFFFTTIAFIFVFSGTLFYLKKEIKEGIILKSTSIKEGPSKIFKDYKTINAGEKIIIEKVKDGFMLVGFPEEYTGWIQVNDIGII